jgi:nucleotide-binding universal stress UspA family protein
MQADRIVVGYKPSRPARAALDWAVREAIMSGALVHVVTAWLPPDGRPPAVGTVAEHWRAQQVAAIRSALAQVAPVRRPVITCEVVMADPVTALAIAAAQADLVVIGSRAHDDLADRLTARLARWPRPFGGQSGDQQCGLVEFCQHINLGCRRQRRLGRLSHGPVLSDGRSVAFSGPSQVS